MKDSLDQYFKDGNPMEDLVGTFVTITEEFHQTCGQHFSHLNKCREVEILSTEYRGEIGYRIKFKTEHGHIFSFIGPSRETNLMTVDTIDYVYTELR